MKYLDQIKVMIEDFLDNKISANKFVQLYEFFLEDNEKKIKKEITEESYILLLDFHDLLGYFEPNVELRKEHHLFFDESHLRKKAKEILERLKELRENIENKERKNRK